MRQDYFTIMPTKDKALRYIDKFGTDRMKYSTFAEALQHYDDLKRLQIPDIGIAKVTCINGAELLNIRKGKDNIPEFNINEMEEFDIE